MLNIRQKVIGGIFAGVFIGMALFEKLKGSKEGIVEDIVISDEETIDNIVKEAELRKKNATNVATIKLVLIDQKTKQNIANISVSDNGINDEIFTLFTDTVDKVKKVKFKKTKDQESYGLRKILELFEKGVVQIGTLTDAVAEFNKELTESERRKGYGYKLIYTNA